MVIRPDCISLTIHRFSVLLIVFSSIFLSFFSSKMCQAISGRDSGAFFVFGGGVEAKL
jgi:hypothetical protein